MARQKTPVTAENQPVPPMRILPGTPEMAAYLQAGYGISLEEAQEVVKMRAENPALYPWEYYQKAKAFLAAYEATPIAISTEPGWKRDRR